MPSPDDPLQVRTTYYTVPGDDSGEACMFQLQVWPLPQALVEELNSLVDGSVKQFLRDKGLAGSGETNLLDRSGPH